VKVAILTRTFTGENSMRTIHQRVRKPLALSVAALATLGAVLGGCGRENQAPATGGGMPAPTEAAKGISLSAPIAGRAGTEFGGFPGAPAPSADARGGVATPEKPKATPRKIIYTATTEILTRDFARSREALGVAVRKFGGYVAESNVSGASGGTRHGTWKARVPVAYFDAFLRELGGLGEVENTQIGSEDVSEEFYDLEARLKNKRAEEERLLQHLKVSTGKLTEILQVEREISRVREEIERMEGRKRFLANQTDLTTVTVTIREASQLVPTTAPGLPAQAGRAFLDSLAAIAALGRAFLLFVVGLIPFAALAAVASAPIFYVVKRRRARRAATVAAESARAAGRTGER
jgi:hypothetical protein